MRDDYTVGVVYSKLLALFISCFVCFVSFFFLLPPSQVVLIRFLREKQTRWTPDEREMWFEKAEGQKERFGSLRDDASLDLTVVVPAYNEERRIVKMLDEAVMYLKKRAELTWEIIVVDDGSKDM